MKEYYSDKERKIIEYLVSQQDVKILVNEILIRNMDAIAIEVFKDNKFAIVTGEELPKREKGIPYISKAEKSILEIMILIDYLVESRYLISLRYSDSDIFDSKDTFRIYDKEKYDYYPDVDDDSNQFSDFNALLAKIASNKYARKLKDGAIGFGYDSKIQSQIYITEFIRKYSGSVFFVSSLLVELKKNDFQTPEQIRFNKQMEDAKEKHTESMAKANLQIKIGWAAFVVSILAVLAAIIVPRYTKTSLAEKKEIIEAIESTKIEIPESINTVITNDNLEVSITNEQLDVNVKNRQINATITNDTLNVKTTNR
ncbi:MAG: hypothetical protein SNH27_09845 [Rikenellaceae bacterium]